jgi:hypothetical protein
MDVADAVVGTEVEVVADAPLLVQAEPEVVLIPTLRAFGAEHGRKEGEEGEQTHGEVLRGKDRRVQRWKARSAREGTVTCGQGADDERLG